MILQLGIGGMPNALGTLIAQSDLKELGMHTELLSDGYLDLYRAGKITNKNKRLFRGKGVFSTCLGSTELYAYIANNMDILSAPMWYVNAPTTIAGIDDFVSINSCIAMDCMGRYALNRQACAISVVLADNLISSPAPTKGPTGGHSWLCPAATSIKRHPSFQY